MALTENSLTSEELVAALDANPDVLTVIKGTLSQREFTIQDKGEHEAFLQNHEATVSQKLTRTHAEKLEADVLEVTGIEKLPNEKYYEYFKRATGEKLSVVGTLQTELDALKKGHSPSAADKARITELENAIATKETEFTGKLSEKDKEILNMKTGSVVQSSLSKVQAKYKAGLDPDMLKMVEGSVVEGVMKRTSVQEDGTVVLLKEDGTVELNQSTFKPVTVEEEIQAKMKSFIDPGKVQTGTGTKKDDVEKITDPNAAINIPSDVDTRVKLSIYLKKLGFLEDSEEFDKKLAEYGKDMKLR